jgi:PAS domain S-box-containing protein
MTDVLAADRAAAPAIAAEPLGLESRPQIIALLAADGMVLQVNRTSLAAIGCSGDDAVGRPFVEAGWSEPERERVAADIAEAAKGVLVRRAIEVPGAGGRAIRLDFSLQPVRDPATGEVTLLIAEGRDITSQRGLATNGDRVLLVDDEPAIRETMAAQLEDMGFVALAVANGAEALAVIQAGQPVDVLVCDFSMPNMNGVETIRRARALLADLPCLLLTGYIGEFEEFSAENAFTVVHKPIKGSALAESIATSFKGHQESPGTG